MPSVFRAPDHITHSERPSETYPVLLQLPLPVLDYSIIIAIVKGDIGATNILRDAVDLSRNLRMTHLLLALGPTTPISLQPTVGTRILWATFTDGRNLLDGPRLTLVPPTQLTDISLTLEKLSRTRTGRIPLIVGDFLDNILSVSSDQGGLYSFLSKLFTRIRMNGQTAFFLATEDMHDSRKMAVLRRFADVVIEYEATQDMANHALKARIIDHTQNRFLTWDNREGTHTTSSQIPTVGRRQTLLIE